MPLPGALLESLLVPPPPLPARSPAPSSSPRHPLVIPCLCPYPSLLVPCPACLCPPPLPSPRPSPSAPQADVKDSTKAGFEDGEDLLHHSLHRVCTKQGHLLKRGRKRASWKRRYFCLCECELYYYYTAEMSNPFQPLGVIGLNPPRNDEASSGGGRSGGSGHTTPKSASGHTTPKSDSAAERMDLASDASEGESPAVSSRGGGSGTEGPPSRSGASSTSPVIIQPHCAGSEHSLPWLYTFAVHTAGRTWHLAAETEKERDEWVQALCACGAQLSASSADPPAKPRNRGLIGLGATPPGAAADAAGIGGGGGAAGSAEGSSGNSGGGSAVQGLHGVLWKRASKVHIAQPSEEQTGQQRDWVTRHFSYRPAEHSVVYRQNATDPLTAVRGVVPLACYDRVEPCAGPLEHLPHAFRLTPRTSAAEGAFVFAAATVEERDKWISTLSSALRDAASAAGQGTTTTPEVPRRGAGGGGRGDDGDRMEISPAMAAVSLAAEPLV